ncbi:MAG: hypothetical protein HUU38_30410 [Anaerolineales bacterium]|nr:hypothetical protein [Anaerolineales bacterium]
MSQLSPELLQMLHQISSSNTHFDPQVILMVLDEDQHVKEYRLETLSSVAPLLSLDGHLRPNSKTLFQSIKENTNA